MFDQCLLYCQSNEEIAKVWSELEKFSRKPGTAFSEAISQFDSLNTHQAQLLKPVLQDELARLSLTTLRQVTPYLMSPRCAKAYTTYCNEQNMLGRPLSTSGCGQTGN